MILKVLFLYPSLPTQVGQTVNEAISLIKSQSDKPNIIALQQIDIPGSFQKNGMLSQIDNNDFIVADITKLNFNITFGIAYALGKRKNFLLSYNCSVSPNNKQIIDLGLFDTIGYKSYKDFKELSFLITDIENTKNIQHPTEEINKSAPIYILDSLSKTDISLRILSKIKKSRIRFRSFDPKEQARLSPYEALNEVQISIAVIVNLLPAHSIDYVNNNYRSAFLSGLAYSLDKISLILQEGEEPFTPEYRDMVKVYNSSKDIDKYINSLAPQVMEALQNSANNLVLKRPQQLLEKLDMGAIAAENEVGMLASYYVDTDESNQTLAGNARLAVGRKGSGKTALFFRVRDQLRRTKKNVVLDLKPEGHQLKRLKQLVLDLLQDAVKEHVATAFWEYLLLLEICHKLLQDDRVFHNRDQNIYSLYRDLTNIYSEDKVEDYDEDDVDFSERMFQLVQKISNKFSTEYGNEKLQYLRTSEVTQLIYKHDIPKLRAKLAEYLQYKEQVWILFDNIDKGWPTRGVTSTDIVILRALLEATRKIEQSLTRLEVDIHTVVFVRNDVFELLVDESSDRGKESKASLDWTDRDLLKEFLRRRIVHNVNVFSDNMPFDEVWKEICITHIEGEYTADYLIERSLMRPRNLLSVVNYAKSYAVNFRRAKIDKDDILKALATYSADIGNEIGLEIRDVFPKIEDILYYFIGSPQSFQLRDLSRYLSEAGVNKEDEYKIIEILFWFAFLGIVREGEEREIYIYDVFYDMKKIKRLAKSFKDETVIICIHPAFWPFLEI